MKRTLATLLITTFLVAAGGGLSAADPIKSIRGTVKEVGEWFLLLIPDDRTDPLKFLLRWKARFVPPKLPLKGDHVLIFYKDKPEGQVIYELNYLRSAQEAPPAGSDPADE